MNRLRLCHDQPGTTAFNRRGKQIGKKCQPIKKGLSFQTILEVWIGVEPTNDGFADRSLTAWVPHHVEFNI